MTHLPRHDWHAPILAALTRAYTGRGDTVRYLEIGIDRGHTIAHIKENVGCEVYGVDITMDNVTAANRSILYPGSHLYQCTSDEFFEMWNSRPGLFVGFDLIFIDGDHSKPQVWKDIRNAMAVVKESGIIAVHDTLPLKQEWANSHCGEGYKVIQRKMMEPDLQVWTMPLFPGLSLITSEYTPLVVEST